MDDLISRKAAIEACIEVSKQEEEYSKMWATGLRYAKRILTKLPSIPAVPLDKLCALLAKNADCPPEHSPVQDHCKENCAECWKSVLKERIEEQDAQEG